MRHAHVSKRTLAGLTTTRNRLRAGGAAESRRPEPDRACHWLWLALIWAPAVASAQMETAGAPSEGPLTVAIGSEGAVLSGNLDADDPVANGRGAFRAYAFEAQEGVRYWLAMTSTDFDAYLMVGRTVGGITDVIETDDDGLKDRNAQIHFDPPRRGTYLIVAQSLYEDRYGDFELTIDPLVPAEPGVVRELQIGDAIPDSLTRRGSLSPNGSFYREYRFEGSEGLRVTARMESSVMDSHLVLAVERDGEKVEIGRDDDGGGGAIGSDAQILATLPEDGWYRLTATTFGEGETGEYTVRLTERPDPVATVARSLVPGAPTLSSLSDSLAAAPEGQFYEDWEYTATAGEEVTFTMGSAELDAYLSVGRLVGGELEELAFDDDSGGALDARLTYTFPDAGKYIVRATTFFAGEGGIYTIGAEASR